MTSRRRRHRTPEGGGQILALAILGFLCCQFACPIAWAQGHTHRARAKSLGVAPDGLATAGWILGIVGTIIMVCNLAYVTLAVLSGKGLGDLWGI